MRRILSYQGHSLIRKLVPDEGGIDLQHLRRFAKLKDLPLHVHDLLTSPPTSTSTSTAGPSPAPSPELFLIAGPVSAISSNDLITSLNSVLQDFQLFEVHVSLLAPTSQEQASLWTAKYWPTVYKKSNPFGPHPSILERAEEEMRSEVASYMDLAEQAATESLDSERGGRVGVVVVERREGRGKVVAVAGDGRWDGWVRTGSGNVVAHAIMRAIGMVAGGLKAREDQEIADEEGKASSPEDGLTQATGTDIFRDTPLSALEVQHYDPSGNANGYLCHELEIYCTHEPCVMCSMAIVHSRFGRVVFKRRMTETGGMCADGELGHGLFWRKELNWTLLGWQWLGEEEQEDGEGVAVSSYLHA
ncbi:tRNA-specific adenosine deaminase subunit tad3 [Cadophora gregata]|uniref:tRNA-specific adenosine deaminase subunit tad3 n=1 Tax=Cadophora gregata TaxID=51156 RepID=UPI0026DC427E|nr:tRNA-specific adenosine deaminase subunit tad3 [Cadophora gregata]KAK0122086.1 tRNA-specific adenosine deaminase subunit tad3 [Cadophora gregata]